MILKNGVVRDQPKAGMAEARTSAAPFDKALTVLLRIDQPDEARFACVNCAVLMSQLKTDGGRALLPEATEQPR